MRDLINRGIILLRNFKLISQKENDLKFTGAIHFFV